MMTVVNINGGGVNLASKSTTEINFVSSARFRAAFETLSGRGSISVASGNGEEGRVGAAGTFDETVEIDGEICCADGYIVQSDNERA